MFCAMIKKHKRFSRDVSISAVNMGWCHCRPLFSNPLLQFSQWKLHLSLSDSFPTDALAWHCFVLPLLIYALAQTRYAQIWFSMRAAGLCVSCVYLGDLNPAGTVEQWGSHSRATAAEIARPCRRKPCRQPWEITGWCGEEAPGCGRVFAQHGGAASGWLSVPRCSGQAAPVTAAWRRRSSAVLPAPHIWPWGLGSAPVLCTWSCAQNSVKEFYLKKPIGWTECKYTAC